MCVCGVCVCVCGVCVDVCVCVCVCVVCMYCVSCFSRTHTVCMSTQKVLEREIFNKCESDLLA